MNIHIKEALHNFRANGGRYDRFWRYYEGKHDLAFATEKFENTFDSLFREFALNLCPAVCDAIADKLKVEGFAVQSAGFSLSERDESRTLNNIWHRNRMAARA